MAQVYPFRKARNSANTVFFDRNELNKLLSLYSRRVAGGEWRDYAIDQRGMSAVFSVFRHTHEAPLFTIVKRGPGPGRSRDYVVRSGHEILIRAASMSEALSVFERKLRVVS